MLDPELLKILVCPKCRQEITYDSARNKLVCGACKLKYPVKDGIPVMLIEEAEKYS